MCKKGLDAIIGPWLTGKDIPTDKENGSPNNRLVSSAVGGVCASDWERYSYRQGHCQL